jgi:hypothetical protein
MSFFKPYNGTTNLRLKRLEKLIWTLIYGGLLAIVLNYFLDQQNPQNSLPLYQFGGLAVVAGVVLIFVRARLHEGSKP